MCCVMQLLCYCTSPGVWLLCNMWLLFVVFANNVLAGIDLSLYVFMCLIAHVFVFIVIIFLDARGGFLTLEAEFI